MTDPEISIVVPTHGRSQSLLRLLRALDEQDAGFVFEVIVVDDASKDDTWEQLERARDEMLLDLLPIRLDRNGGASHVWNVGWRAARCPLVAFTDDDCKPTPGWLRALRDGLRTAEIVQGVTIPDPDERHLMGAWGRSIEEREEGVYPTCNVGYHRDALERADGFDEGFGRIAGPEDIELAWRLIADGASHAFAPDAVVHHEIHQMSFLEHLQEKHRWAGLVYMVKKNPELRRSLASPHIWKPSHPPALLAAAGLGVLGLGGRRWPGKVLGAALFVPYIRFRMVVWQQPVPRRQRIALLPAILSADLYEIGVLARASVRERTLLL